MTCRRDAMVRAKAAAAAAAAYDVDQRHGGSWWAPWRGYLYVTAGGRARRVDPRFNSRMARRTATCVVPATWQAVRCASAVRGRVRLWSWRRRMLSCPIWETFFFSFTLLTICMIGYVAFFH